MKPLDFIKTKRGAIGMITEVSLHGEEKTASIEFIKTLEATKTAWWHEDEFEIIDNLPDLLSRQLAHPMGTNSLQPFKTK